MTETAAPLRIKKQARPVLAAQGAGVGAQDRPEQLHLSDDGAQRVDMVDQHLHQQHPIQSGQHRLPLERRQRRRSRSG